MSADPAASGSAPERKGESRLDVLKALGDNTRYAIYLEVARAPAPIPTSTIADTLGLHPNTVRPHLERMRDVGLLEVRPAPPGGVGRPQHLYSLAPDAPSLGLEPPVFPLLARMLLDMGIAAGLGGTEALAAGHMHGRVLAATVPRGSDTSAADVVTEVSVRLGFDPARVDDDDGGCTIGFAHCPFAELAEANPELVCSLHRGLVEGTVAEVGGAEMTEFHDRVHRQPCLTHVTPR